MSAVRKHLYLRTYYDIRIKERLVRASSEVAAAELCLHPNYDTRSTIIKLLEVPMGKKSAKKVNLDRINALRKQYDAFLEEDKKRKERNEFILGKLDNIRYNSTAIQPRNKPIVCGELYAAYNRLSYRPDHRAMMALPPEPHLSHRSLQAELPSKFSDDTSLLREISKKYILIPRLRPSLLDDYVEPVPPRSHSSVNPNYAQPEPNSNIINNENWKSKYDILEKLKINENEGQTNYTKDDIVPVKDEPLFGKNNANAHDEYAGTKTYKPEEFTKYDQEIPEKDLSFIEDKIETDTLAQTRNDEMKIEDPRPNINNVETFKESPIANDYNNTIYDHPAQSNDLDYNDTLKENEVRNVNTENDIENNFYPDVNTASNLKVEDIGQLATDIQNQNEPIQSENLQQSQYQEQAGYYQQEEYPQHEEYPPQEEYRPQAYPSDSYQHEEIHVESDAVYPDPEKDYLDKDDYSPIEVVDSSQQAQPIITETIDSQETEYPVEVLRAEEFTPKEGVQLEDGVNVNPVYLASDANNEQALENSPDNTNVQNSEVPAPDNSGIQDFDAENREMFYSEETGAYNQEATREAYNQEYNQHEFYPQQQDNTAYYEGAEGLPEEQAYPVGVNEYEETDTRYDQNYEQQYTGQYDKQAYQQQQQMQYEQPQETYDQVDPSQQQYQEYAYEQPDNETMQNIEQVLDNEQGFSERQNAESHETPALEQTGEVAKQ